MKDFQDYKNVWIFAEQRDLELMGVAKELLGEGYRLSRGLSGDSKVCAVIMGYGVSNLIDEAYAYGADIVYTMDHPLLKNYTTDAYAKVLSEAIKSYKPEIVLFGATHIGRDLAPRVAARLNTGLTADCTRLDVNTSDYMDYLEKNTTASLNGLDRNDTSTMLKQTRPAFGGNLMATIITPNSRPQMSTVRPGVMAKLERDDSHKGIHINVAVNLEDDDIRVKVRDVIIEAKKIVSLTDAKIICSGGRGVGSKEGFKLMEEFAETVGGMVGASRGAADSGWIDQSRQVGQTGTTVKPKIYFACGISGAIQHLAGMQESDIIIAINKDPDCPMMKIADYALEGDLKQVIPEIIEQWKSN